MRLRPVSLLLAPLWLLLALSLLASCAPGAGKVSAGGGGGGGVATSVVITVVAAGTSVPGLGTGGGTLPPYPTPEPPTAIPTLPSASLSVPQLKYRLLDQFPNFFF